MYFFGHRDTPSTIQNYLSDVITFLIEKKGVDTFYVGHNGAFDALVQKVLAQLKTAYPHIRYEIVLAYLPTAANTLTFPKQVHTLYPDGLEDVPPRFAIAARNKWMVEKADFVISYTVFSSGGAAQFSDLARRKGKTVINLAENYQQ